MTEDCNTITEVLLRSGTDQAGRIHKNLDPNSIELHGFGIEQWMKFAYNFAKHVNYFEVSDHKNPSGDWQDFFKNEEETSEWLTEIENSNELTPHLTLFLCFLKLLNLSKKRFNQLTKRHLDYYFKKVLQIEKIPAQEDKVFLLFELAKNFKQEKLVEGLSLNGGKDALGKKRIYQLSEELVANKTKVAQLKNVYFHPDTANSVTGEFSYLKAAEVANSYDGKGTDFPEGTSTAWRPFGYHLGENSLLPELENAKVGFSISSPVLALSEGDRYLKVEFTFISPVTDLTKAQLFGVINVFYTGKKKWVGPLPLKKLVSAELPTGFKNEIDGHKISLCLYLEPGDDPTANYNKEVHLESFETSDPVFRFLVNVNTKTGHQVYKSLVKQIVSVKISVDVKNMRALDMESDTGKLNPDKPMFPFTSTPIKGSNLSIYHKEIFSKKW
ncbi:MAG: phage baseplate protein, partial [Flavobacteriales bacterium]|nr:phage baseplate protein [Flavobacteriales bacterium]